MTTEPGTFRTRQAPAGQESFRELFRQLAEDGQRLLRQEAALAKLEVGETIALLIVDGSHVAVGVVLGLLGALSLTAFLVLFLGAFVFGERYWLSALLIGAIYCGVGGYLTRGALARAKARRLRTRVTVVPVATEAPDPAGVVRPAAPVTIRTG